MESQTQHLPVSQNQLPQWSRVGQLDKSRYPKAFGKDQLMVGETADSDEDVSSLSGIDKLDDQNPAIRVEYLERSIRFLKAQHQEVLGSLHAEIDKLRNDNKELHFKLVMRQREQDDGTVGFDDEEDEEEVEKQPREDGAIESYLKEKSTTRSMSGSAKSRVQILERQITELKHQVRELKNKNEYLTQLVDKNQLQQEPNSVPGVASQRDGQSSASGSELSLNMERMVFSQHSRSILVQDRTGSARRRPKPEELEKIVNYLYRTNLQQERELAKVKSDLKEVLYSQKWTPDAYLLAKAYVASDGAAAETDILPKLQMRNASRKLPEIAYIARDSVSLPALKNTMGTKAAERRKRTQILQKARLHKEVS